MSLVDDHIFVERHRGSGHYTLTAFVRDRLCDFSFAHSLNFYFYGGDEIDIMKQAYLEDMKVKGMIFAEDDDD